MHYVKSKDYGINNLSNTGFKTIEIAIKKYEAMVITMASCNILCAIEQAKLFLHRMALRYTKEETISERDKGAI